MTIEDFMFLNFARSVNPSEKRKVTKTYYPEKKTLYDISLSKAERKGKSLEEIKILKEEKLRKQKESCK